LSDPEEHVRNALIGIVAALVVLFLLARHPTSSGPSATGDGGSTTGHLSVVPTVRSVTVSPGNVSFDNCTGGGGATDSTQHALGYPNGECSVGSPGVNASYPITVTYNGLPGAVDVTGSNAVPADNGAQWALCTSNPAPGSALPGCTGYRGQPGNDQYELITFAPGVTDSFVLGTSVACDAEFDQGGGCAANPPEFHNQVQHEGLVLVGPKSWDDHSTAWSVTVTWTAASGS
jgi:hypothetical protein